MLTAQIILKFLTIKVIKISWNTIYLYYLTSLKKLQNLLKPSKEFAWSLNRVYLYFINGGFQHIITRTGIYSYFEIFVKTCMGFEM